MRYNISLTGDTARLQRMYHLAPRELRKASQRTINTVVPKYQKQLGGEIPRAAGASVGGYRRVRSKRKLATVKRMRGVIWQGTLKIPAKYAAGRLRQTKSGVRAGRTFFEGAFIATMKSGYRGVFRRKGAGRFPLEQEYLYLDDAKAIVARLATSARRDLKVILEDEARKTWKKTVG
jgi:hypothetical protein